MDRDSFNVTDLFVWQASKYVCVRGGAHPRHPATQVRAETATGTGEAERSTTPGAGGSGETS